MASIGTKSLGNVSSEVSAKNSGLFNWPMPFEDSDEAVLMDLMGTSRTITISGVFTGTVSELRTFISDIEGLQNGNQAGLTFVSSWKDYSATKFLIQDFTNTKIQADESKVEYNLVIVEGIALE